MQKFDIVKAVEDPQLFKPFFRGDLRTWKSWLTFFKVLSGRTDLDAGEMALFQQCTGLDELPQEDIKEVYLIIGRRGGKSTVTALLAVIYALWGGWEKYLAPGETANAFIIATNKQQAGIIKRYVSAILAMPPFKRLVKKELSEEIMLHNGVNIAIKPASWRSSRGFSVGLLCMEELAFWRFESDSETCDKEIYTAIKPGMTTIKNSLVVGLSTPFTRQGLLWQKYRDHFGKPGPVLIWRAPTWTMNQTMTRAELERDFLEGLGESEFDAEYGANFRSDLESWMPHDLYEAAVDPISHRPPVSGIVYVGFCDPAEGLRKGGDSMTFAVAHMARPDGDPPAFEGLDEGEDQRVYFLDKVVEFRPPFNPEAVISEISRVCEEYDISTVHQDRHALAWIASDFQKHGVAVQVSKLNKSQIYEHFGIAVGRGRVRLIENDRMRRQALGLQRYLKSGGLVKIDHLSGRHDDVINAAAGAVTLLSTREPLNAEVFGWM